MTCSLNFSPRVSWFFLAVQRRDNANCTFHPLLPKALKEILTPLKGWKILQHKYFQIHRNVL